MSTDDLKPKSMFSFIERFHSRGQESYTSIGAQESVHVKKISTPTGLVWYTNNAATSLFGNQYGCHDVMQKHSTVLLGVVTTQFSI